MYNLTFEAFDNYLKSKNLKQATRETYKVYYNKFNYEAFSQATVNEFLSLDSNRNTGAKGFLFNFKRFLLINYIEIGLTKEAKALISEVDIPRLTGRKKERIVNPLTEEEINLIGSYLENERLKLMLLVSYKAGLRMGELLTIKIKAFNWAEWNKDKSKMGEVRVFGKGDKEGIAFIPSPLMARILDYIKTSSLPLDGLLFCTKGKIKSNGRLWEMKLKEAGIKAGLTQIDPNTGQPDKKSIVHPHRLRHSLGGLLIKNKVDIRKIQETLRHSSITSTQIYTKIDKEDLKQDLKDIL